MIVNIEYRPFEMEGDGDGAFPDTHRDVADGLGDGEGEDADSWDREHLNAYNGDGVGDGWGSGDGDGWQDGW